MPIGVCHPPLTKFCFCWKGDEVEVVWLYKQPFITTLDSIEASYYDQEFDPIKFKGKKKDGAQTKIYMETRDASEI